MSINRNITDEGEGHIGIYFESGGYQLVGRLFLAQGMAPKPIAILLHGCPGIELNFDIAHMLRERGWHSLIFHYRGCWGSAGPYAFRTIPDDVRAAIDHLSTGIYPQVDAKRIVLIGHSLGGFAAIISAARDERARAVAVLGSAVEFHTGHSARELIEREFTPWLRLSVDEFIAQRASLDESFQPIHQVAHIAPRPLLIVHGEKDVWIPSAQAQKLCEAAREPRQLILMPDANHSFAWHRTELREHVWRWLESLRFTY